MRSLRATKLASLILALAFAPGFVLIAAAQSSAPGPQPEAVPANQSNRAPDTPPPGPSTSASDQLQLTEDQKQKIAALVDDENEKIAAISNDTSLTPEQKGQKEQEIRQAEIPRMKAVLTPEQLQKLNAIVQQRNRQPHDDAVSPQMPHR
jgi:Spy/CpxP family protein refolding chaperone